MNHFGPFWSRKCQNPVLTKAILTKIVVLTTLVHHTFRQYRGHSLPTPKKPCTQIKAQFAQTISELFVQTVRAVPSLTFKIRKTFLAERVCTNFRNARLFIILFVRNFWRVCSRFWLSVRNSVWGPFNRNSRGNPPLCWLGGGVL